MKTYSLKALSTEEYSTIIKEVWNNHRFANLGRQKPGYGKSVKYVDNSIDMRTGAIWKVSFRCLGDLKEFDTTAKTEPLEYKTMFEAIMAWLQD